MMENMFDGIWYAIGCLILVCMLIAVGVTLGVQKCTHTYKVKIERVSPAKADTVAVDKEIPRGGK